ncbi:DUF4255 domain-containing protein [Cellulomonas fimi]|uniref:Pvc16 N-terminal domain-containing protein n=1 Tax=Cellulomonas fimi (strain ATCC 484 / DSM 20113 / JCM 1341 / CCUG 24087 / LMG 16345 / NBRC 15513 / NCIMB 8980 / NCTC 7547 / NRS-133) TaxID=590998 RepID=F4H5K5_CELFA|nr:DUF4255 domain-containing protein [Cellulomonas fimi]AEE44329.1 hypothetical protein Celf_0183 [Cellulomonas fimi ATCC 484]NNH08146.1 DUF4255 domain-containing protein [Cellulomonas fimi]VEH26136.1 Uncharacterised protein [Cellulomonas fimi]
MIGQVDEALRTLVREAVDSSDVEVVLDAPTKDWAARRNAPTIDVYLYDLREDLRRRSRGFLENRREGEVTARFLPPRHFRLSYLVTAWTQRPEDEHRLLDATLAYLLRFDALPGRVLDPQLADHGARVPLFVGLPPPEDRGFADVWTALGGELKPSIDVVVDVPVLTPVSVPFGPPVEEGLRIDLHDTDGGGQDLGAHAHVPPAPTPRPAPGGSTSSPRARARKRR